MNKQRIYIVIDYEYFDRI